MSFEKDLKVIMEIYPGLNYYQKERRRLLKGTFEFYAFYDVIEDMFILNPLRNDTIKHEVIYDSYEIEVEFLPDFPHSFPQVREIGGRIQRIAKKYNIKDIRELHVNKNQNNAVCLCPKPEEYLRYLDGIDIVDFFNALVLPYFYGLSYYERHKQLPRDAYGHGDLGIFEFYIEHRKEGKDIPLIEACIKSLSDKKSKEYLKRKDKIKGHWNCICGSSKKFRDCHVKALQGLRLLKEDTESLKIKLSFPKK